MRHLVINICIHLYLFLIITALPIRTCVCRLIQMDALSEEGIFRVASSTLKIRRLAALFDTGEATDAAVKEIQDPHVFSGALKLYLRELPVPLLGQNYEPWMSVHQSNSEERKKETIDKILSGLPQNTLDPWCLMITPNAFSISFET